MFQLIFLGTVGHLSWKSEPTLSNAVCCNESFTSEENTLANNHVNHVDTNASCTKNYTTHGQSLTVYKNSPRTKHHWQFQLNCQESNWLSHFYPSLLHIERPTMNNIHKEASNQVGHLYLMSGSPQIPSTAHTWELCKLSPVLHQPRLYCQKKLWTFKFWKVFIRAKHNSLQSHHSHLKHAYIRSTWSQYVQKQ